MTDDRDIERLLRRYTPANPPVSLDARIAGLAAASGGPAARTWPWAAAAAALLALTIGLHASTRTPSHDSLSTDPMFRDAVSALSMQLGGDPAARRLAESMLRQEAAERERRQEAIERR
jgi:hypothetical protein